MARTLCPADTSNLLTRRARDATEEAIDECTSRLAPSPHLLRHTARPGAVTRAALTEHTYQEMVRSRVYGILAGYADQNDHDTLRADFRPGV